MLIISCLLNISLTVKIEIYFFLTFKFNLANTSEHKFFFANFKNMCVYIFVIFALELFIGLYVQQFS